MSLKRHEFIRLSAGSVSLGGIFFAGIPSRAERARGSCTLAPAPEVSPITVEERQARIAKAQRLMTQNTIAATILDSGTSMVYFTGMSWGASVRWWPLSRRRVKLPRFAASRNSHDSLPRLAQLVL